MPRSTKIVATLGPACSKPEVLRRMLAAGVDVVRLNFSHGTAQDHVDRAQLVREVARALGREVAIMADLQGPKIRIGKFANGKVELVPGARFILDAECELGRRDARRPRLQGTRQRRRPGLGAAARRRPDQARRRDRRRSADRHARRARRRAVEQQGHQPHGRRPFRAGADHEGHGRHQDGRAAGGRLPRRVVPEKQGRHVHGAAADARCRAAARC